MAYENRPRRPRLMNLEDVPAVDGPAYSIVRNLEIPDQPEQERLLQGVGSIAAKYAHTASATVHLWPAGKLYLPLLSVEAAVILGKAAHRQHKPILPTLERIVSAAKRQTTPTLNATLKDGPKFRNHPRQPHAIALPLESPKVTSDMRLLAGLVKKELYASVPYSNNTIRHLTLGTSNRRYDHSDQIKLNELDLPEWQPGTTLTFGELRIVDMSQIRQEPPLLPQSN